MVTVVFPEAHRRGGVERIGWELLRHFGSRDGEAVFVGQQLDEAGLPAGVRHEAVGDGAAMRPRVFRRCAAEALARMPTGPLLSLGANCPAGDVLVVNSIHRAWLQRGRPARIAGRDVPNAMRYLLPRHQELLMLERRYFSHRTAKVVAVSSVVADQLGDLYGVDRGRVTIIPNGFDPNQCSLPRRLALREQRRAKLGIPDDEIVLLFVANELHRKGLGVLIEAVSRSTAPMAIHVVGRAPIDPYEEMIASRGLQGRVRYHGSTDDIALFHAIADALVLPTQYEAFALTIVEALGSGLPVITTAVPGAGDCIHHGTNGLLQQDPADPRELAGLLDMIVDVGARDRLAAQAAPSVARYEWSALMQRFEEVLDAD